MGFMSLPFNLPWTRFGKGMQARAVLLDKINGASMPWYSL